MPLLLLTKRDKDSKNKKSNKTEGIVNGHHSCLKEMIPQTRAMAMIGEGISAVILIFNSPRPIIYDAMKFCTLFLFFFCKFYALFLSSYQKHTLIILNSPCIVDHGRNLTNQGSAWC